MRPTIYTINWVLKKPLSIEFALPKKIIYRVHSVFGTYGFPSDYWLRDAQGALVALFCNGRGKRVNK